MITIPTFEEKTALFDWLIANKSALTAQKKSAVKFADAVSFLAPLITEKGDTVKQESIPASATQIKVRSVINTTKLLDSHDDVHIDGLWSKSIMETKDNYLVNQHDFTFEGIITDKVNVFTKMMSWKDLGYNYSGQTQALIYDSTIDKEDSPMMFDMYRKGKVKQHSVGMRYIKLEMAINDKRYEKEQAVWDKYITHIVNKEDAEANGYFWAVTEAKNFEGSAVVKGANFATPTMNVTQTKNEPPSTRSEPDKSTHIDYTGLLNELKLFKK